MLTLLGLDGAVVTPLGGLAADEQLAPVRIYCQQGVSLIELHADRHNPLRLRCFQGQRYAPVEPALALDYRSGVNLFSGIKQRTQCRGHIIGKALPTGYRPDGERAIRTDVRIPAPHANEKHGGRTLKVADAHCLDLAGLVSPAFGLTASLSLGLRAN